ncbi:MAG: ferredoxin [Deltaproteobacteria bacterium]|nr:MAG: ferredoxin [Deltaproteobacteria bacterium]
MTGDLARVVEVRADGKRCCGAGHCLRIAPQVFDQDERDGTVIVLRPHVPSDLAQLVQEAALVCPTRAITVTIQVGQCP